MRPGRPIVAVALAAVAVSAGEPAPAAPRLRADVDAPRTVVVGRSWRAVVAVTRGRERVTGVRVVVRARLGTTSRAARARPARRRGSYAASITFARAGRWTYEVRVAGRVLARGAVAVRRPRVGTPLPPDPPTAPTCQPASAASARFSEWCIARGAQVHPHDVWPAADGTVWYTGQNDGTIGRLNPATGAFRVIPLPAGAAPHGVVVGPDGAAWITDQGLDAIVRVDGATDAVVVYPIPAPNSNPNTATFDPSGDLWFTGATGYYGRVDVGAPPATATTVWTTRDFPIGTGPYGIDATPAGDVYFVSLEGGYLARVDPADGSVEYIEDPAAGNEGPRRVWSDSTGKLWVTQYFGHRLARYDPTTRAWRQWTLPAGEASLPYAVWVDEGTGSVWVTDFATNALVRFDPIAETFESFPFPTPGALVRQIVGDGRGVWGAESATEKIVLFRPTAR